MKRAFAFAFTVLALASSAAAADVACNTVVTSCADAGKEPSASVTCDNAVTDSAGATFCGEARCCVNKSPVECAAVFACPSDDPIPGAMCTPGVNCDPATCCQTTGVTTVPCTDFPCSGAKPIPIQGVVCTPEKDCTIDRCCQAGVTPPPPPPPPGPGPAPCSANNVVCVNGYKKDYSGKEVKCLRVQLSYTIVKNPCTTTFCCNPSTSGYRPPPPPPPPTGYKGLVRCNTKVKCAKYNKDSKVGGIRRCKARTGTSMPCTQAYCCRGAIYY